MNNLTTKNNLKDISFVLACMSDTSEVSDFLIDLLTPAEIGEFSRRFQVAQLLENNISYVAIEKQTGMSSTTIARVSKFLKGQYKGYKRALSLLKSVSDKHHNGHHS